MSKNWSIVYMAVAATDDGSCSFDNAGICGYRIISRWSQIPSEWCIDFYGVNCVCSHWEKRDFSEKVSLLKRT